MFRLLIAIVLNLLQPGLGQFINGQWRKGTLFLVLVLIGISLQYTVSPIPIAILKIWTLADVIIVGIRTLRSKATAPTGKKFITKTAIAVAAASVLAFAVEELTVKLTSQKLNVPSGALLSDQENDALKQEAEEYLNHKYGKEFTVDRINNIQQTGEYRMKGHVRGDSGVDFKIGKDKSTGVFTDQFFYEMMSAQSREEIGPVIKRLYPDHVSWSSDFTAQDGVEEQFARPMPSFKELRQKTDQYTQVIKIFVIKNISGSSQEQELKNIFQLVSFLKEQGIQASLEVNYFNEGLIGQGVREITGQTQLDYDKQLQAVLQLRRADLSKLSSPDELKSFIQTPID